MMWLYVIIGIIVVALPIFLLVRGVYANFIEREMVRKLCAMLFPRGEAQKDEVLDNINSMTNGRFSREDLLDFYLKIKGLQIIDLHAGSDDGVRRYLMKPTRIRLSYFEQVRFYETYLNYPQATGINATEKNAASAMTDEAQAENPTS